MDFNFLKRQAHSEAILASSAMLLPQTPQCWVSRYSPACPNYKLQIFPRPTFLPMCDCLCLTLIGPCWTFLQLLCSLPVHSWQSRLLPSKPFQYALQNHSSLYPFPVTKSSLCVLIAASCLSGIVC